MSGIAIGCIVCNEYVQLTPEEENAIYNGKNISKVCDKCKEAISFAKELNEMGGISLWRKIEKSIVQIQ